MNGEDMNNSYRRVVADDYRPLVSQPPVVNTKVRTNSYQINFLFFCNYLSFHHDYLDRRLNDILFKGIPSSLTPPRDPSPPQMTEIYDVNGQATAEVLFLIVYLTSLTAFLSTNTGLICVFCVWVTTWELYHSFLRRSNDGLKCGERRSKRRTRREKRWGEREIKPRIWNVISKSQYHF